MTARTPGRWLVFDVGCIECGEDSNVVGTYQDEAEARAVARTVDKTCGWRGGQHEFEVFDLLAPQATIYSDALKQSTNQPGETS